MPAFGSATKLVARKTASLLAHIEEYLAWRHDHAALKAIIDRGSTAVRGTTCERQTRRSRFPATLPPPLHAAFAPHHTFALAPPSMGRQASSSSAAQPSSSLTLEWALGQLNKQLGGLETQPCRVQSSGGKLSPCKAPLPTGSSSSSQELACMVSPFARRAGLPLAHVAAAPSTVDRASEAVGSAPGQTRQHAVMAATACPPAWAPPPYWRVVSCCL